MTLQEARSADLHNIRQWIHYEIGGRHEFRNKFGIRKSMGEKLAFIYVHVY